MKKKFSSSDGFVKYGGSGTTSTDYWAGYLNDTTTSGWYGSINETYKKMLIKGTYYLGGYSYYVSYKNAICSVSNTTDRTSECNKTSSIWKGYVGLPRAGEMFSAQLADKQNGLSASYIWLITPYDNSRISEVDYDGYSSYNPPSSGPALGVRPSINLNSNVVITSGEGTAQIPYEIKCDTCNT